MSRFRHPHLVRGTVHTPQGAFQIRRGVIDASDAVGEANGWLQVEDLPPEVTLDRGTMAEEGVPVTLLPDGS